MMPIEVTLIVPIVLISLIFCYPLHLHLSEARKKKMLEVLILKSVHEHQELTSLEIVRQVQARSSGRVDHNLVGLYNVIHALVAKQKLYAITGATRREAAYAVTGKGEKWLARNTKV